MRYLRFAPLASLGLAIGLVLALGAPSSGRGAQSLPVPGPAAQSGPALALHGPRVVVVRDLPAVAAQAAGQARPVLIPRRAPPGLSAADLGAPAPGAGCAVSMWMCLVSYFIFATQSAISRTES